MSAEARRPAPVGEWPVGRGRRVLVATPECTAGAALAGVLRGHGYRATVAATGAEALRAARLEAPDAAVVDLELAGMSATELIRALRAGEETAAAPIIALSTSADAAQRLAGLRAGANDYLMAPVSDQELLARLATALALCPQKAGLLLLVLGSKGGVGASVVAANLALALQHAGRGQVLLVDVARPQGALDVLLNVRPSGAAAQLLGRLGELEPGDLGGFFTPHASGLQALLLEGAGPAPQPEALRSLLATLRQVQDLVVVDGGSLLDEPAAALAELADRVLLVLTPEIPAVRNAKRCLQWLGELGVGPGRVVPVLNRYPQPGGLPRGDIEGVLGLPLGGCLANEVRLVAYSVNRGVPLAASHPQSGLARQVAALAGSVTQVAGGGEAPAPRLLLRLPFVRRLSQA